MAGMHAHAMSMEAPLLAERLRRDTRTAHASLETVLALTTPPLRRERFVQVLRGFRDFHTAWEPQAWALLDEADVQGRNGRRSLLDRDIAALGGGAASFRTFDAPFDLTFLADRAAAWGSLYVMEGSTLGGQLISRALRAMSWAPPGGLTYFNPYGERTSRMWAKFKVALEAASPSLDPEAVVSGAAATFEALRAGFAPGLAVAA